MKKYVHRMKAAFAPAIVALVALQPIAVRANGKALDALQATVQATTVPWMDHSLQIGTALFSMLMVVTFVTAIVRYAALNHTIEGCGHMFMDLFMKVIPLYVIMASATTLLPNIVDIANQLSGQISGVSVTGPDEILGIGTKIGGSIIQGTSHIFPASSFAQQFSNIEGTLAHGAPLPAAPNLFLQTAAEIVGLIAAAIIMFCFALIAFEYFFAFAQAYITLSVGALSLGWLASIGTKRKLSTLLRPALSVFKPLPPPYRGRRRLSPGRAA